MMQNLYFCFHTPKCPLKIGIGLLMPVCWITLKRSRKSRTRGILKGLWVVWKGGSGNLLEISRASGVAEGGGEAGGAVAGSFLSRQNFMLVPFLDVSQVCWDWSGPARPLRHLAANLFAAFASPLGRRSFATAGLALSAGRWEGRSPGQTPDSSHINITLV